MTLHQALCRLMQKGWWVILAEKSCSLRRSYDRSEENRTFGGVDAMMHDHLDRASWLPDSYDEPIQRAVAAGWYVTCGPDRQSRKGEVLVGITHRDGRHKSERLDSIDVAVNSNCIGIVVRKMLR